MFWGPRANLKSAAGASRAKWGRRALLLGRHRGPAESHLRITPVSHPPGEGRILTAPTTARATVAAAALTAACAAAVATATNLAATALAAAFAAATLAAALAAATLAAAAFSATAVCAGTLAAAAGGSVQHGAALLGVRCAKRVYTRGARQ